MTARRRDAGRSSGVYRARGAFEEAAACVRPLGESALGAVARRGGGAFSVLGTSQRSGQNTQRFQGSQKVAQEREALGAGLQAAAAEGSSDGSAARGACRRGPWPFEALQEATPKASVPAGSGHAGRSPEEGWLPAPGPLPGRALWTRSLAATAQVEQAPRARRRQGSAGGSILGFLPTSAAAFPPPDGARVSKDGF